MGVQINGSEGNVIATKGTFSGDVGIGGTLTYEDVTNIDSVGLITARTGIEIGARPGVGASISVDGNAIFSGITTTGGVINANSDVNISNKIIGIGTNGKIGIGTNIITNSDVFVEMVGSASQSPRLQFNNKPAVGSNGGEIGGMMFRNDNDSVGYMLCRRESAADDAYLIFGTQATSGSVGERLRIDSSGRVLIGTSSDSAGVGASPILQVEDVTGTPYGRVSFAYNGADAVGPGIYFAKSRGTSNGATTIVQEDDQLGAIFFTGADGNDRASRGASIQCHVDGTPGSNDMPGRLTFRTTEDGATTSAERLRISSSGEITATLGSSNSDNFNIQGHASQGRTILKLIAGNDSSTASTSLRLVRSNGTNVLSLSLTHNSDDGHIVNQATGGSIKFQVNESGSALVRNVMTDTGHFVNCRGSSGRIAFGTGDGVLYSGFGRYDGAAQDVGISHYATTNAGTTFVEHFRMEHNGTLKGTDTSIGSLSDSRLKKNIADYSYDISRFKQFKPKTFDWINPEVHGDKSNVKGFIAQDIETVDGDWVEDSWIKESDPDFSLISDTTTTNGAGETVGISKISKFGYKDAMYISVIQQLIGRIETLETKVTALEGS